MFAYSRREQGSLEVVIRYRLLLPACLAALALVPSAFAHVGISVVIQGPGRVTGCTADSSGGQDCIDCHLVAPGNYQGCTALIPSTEGGNGITLTAVPDPGQVFSGWGGDCSGTGPCVLDNKTAHIVTAGFGRPPPPAPQLKLTVVKAGSGSGYVGGSGGIDCGPTCSALQGPGAKVQLTALADAGSTFTGWSGGCSGTGPCNVTVTASLTITATFELPRVQVVALAAAGLRGKSTQLRYRLVNARPRHREAVNVFSGRGLVANVPRARPRLAGNVYSIAWPVPRALPAGTYRFCVVTTDPTTSKTNQGCARLKIR
jgi:uncharacterized repeat protein (TIGR02543 family)